MANPPYDAPVADTSAVVTYERNKKTIQMIHWSYDDTPTGGGITITIGGITIWAVDITAGGPGWMPINSLALGSTETVTVTLAAAGGAVSGKLNVTLS